MKKLLIAMLMALMLIPTIALCGDDDYGDAYYLIYKEDIYWQKVDLETVGHHVSGNPLGHGQVLVDGNKAVIAQGQGGVHLYGDEIINGTARVTGTPRVEYFFDPGAPGWPATSNYSCKGGTLLNGVVWGQDMHMRLHPCPAWDGPWGEPGYETGRVESESYGLVTDGTYLYGSDNPGTPEGSNYNNADSKIYKWQIVDGVPTIVPGWPITISNKPWLSAIGYYNGKLYAAEAFRGRNIWEIDCETGEAHTILDEDNLMPEEMGTDDWYFGQIARCGDVIAYANYTGHLATWKLKNGVWKKESCKPGIPIQHTGAGFYLGLTLKPGPDGNGKYAWATIANRVLFFDLFPDWTPKALGEARQAKNNYPVAVNNAVVTKIGTGEFWIEDKDRASGCRVAWDGDVPPVGNLVTVKGGMGIMDSGEKVINATEVADNGVSPTAIEPVYMTNKTAGPGPDGAGLATDGMLVKVTGKLTFMNPEGNAIYIDDGSGVANDLAEDVAGLKVTTESLINVEGIFEAFPGSTEVTVTGIVRLEKLTDGTIIRKVEALSDFDIVLTNL